MANLLACVGYAVTREYYVNDAGAQVSEMPRGERCGYGLFERKNRDVIERVHGGTFYWILVCHALL